MITVKLTFFLLLITVTLYSSGNGQGFDYQEDNEGHTLEYAETTKAVKECVKGSCENSICDCCPGYALKKNKCEKCYCGENFNCTFDGSSKKCLCPPGYGMDGKCKKCDCGKDFNCTFTGFWTTKKTCVCPTGYTEASGICKADCKSNPCKNGGNCTVDKDDIVCKCNNSYIGEFCEIKNPCLPENPCQNGGTCTILGNKTKCQCQDKYTGDFCEKASDECSGVTCANGGQCIINEGKPICNCTDEFTGDYCEKKCNCENGKCNQNAGKIECICNPEFGKGVDGKCKACECGKSANCTFTKGSIWNWYQDVKTCICPKGFQEVKGMCVDPDIHNPCNNNPCKNGAQCKKNGVEAECICLPGYSGKLCDIDVCDSILCQNNGTCERDTGEAVCKCKDAYTGATCEIEKCSKIQCKNEGHCEIKNKEAVCNCTDRYTGDFCDIEKCSLIQCKNGGHCEIKYGRAVCNCTDKYAGRFCDFECNCENGKCYEISGNVECICNAEYGKNGAGDCKACECGKGANCTFTTEGMWNLDEDVKTCICPKGLQEASGMCVDPKVYNPCDNNPCKNRAKCEKNGLEAKCICSLGYSGNLCEMDVCDPNPCKNNGTCERYTGKAVCKCKDGYTGTTCEIELSTLPPATPSTATVSSSLSTDTTTCECENGKCVTVMGKKVCICNPEYGRNDVGDCKACECGKGANCTFKTEIEPWNLPEEVKTCICPKGFAEVDGMCVDKSITLPHTTTTKPTVTETSPVSTNTTNNSSSLSPIATTTPKGTGTSPFSKTTINNSSTLPPTETTTPKETGTSPFSTNTIKSSTIGTPTSPKPMTTFQTSPETYSFSTSENTGTDIPIRTQPTVDVITNTTDDISNVTSNSTTESNSTESVESTSTSVTTRTSVEETSATTPTGKEICKINPCKNGGTCIEEKNGQKCVCPYPYVGETCQDDYWCTGLGKELCGENKCTFDPITRIGHCSCTDGKYYNYNKKECQIVDRCPLMPGKCKKVNEICKNNDCQCKENFKKDSKDECVPDFCETMAKEVCKSNTVCKENVNDPENVICECKEGYIYNGVECVKVSKCSMPGILGCQQTCDEKTESCSCLQGYELQQDQKSCTLKNKSVACSKDCKPGVCFKDEDESDTCKCPLMHVYKDGACKDLCTAGSLPPNLCPKDACESHPDFGFRCVCEGDWTYDVNNVTCRRKAMCSEGNGIETCANKSAKCVEDEKLGFKCVCSKFEEMDEDGICKKKCDLKEHQDACGAQLAECEMEGSDVFCKCPTLLTVNEKGMCTELATSFSGELPFDKKFYTSQMYFAPGDKVAVPNYEKMRQDFRNAMKLIYGRIYRFGDILSCNDTNSSFTCFVVIEFNSDPKDQVKLLGDPSTCVMGDADSCLIPPALILVKKGINTDTLTQTDPCAESIKRANCGGIETVCRNVTDDRKNFECACADGFQSFGMIYPVSDRRTVIHKCQDVNECLLPRACPNRTRCINTYGSYECLCQNGFKPVTAAANPKETGCVDVCGPNVCGNGACQIDGYHYSCKCNDGYSGADCKEKLDKGGEFKGAQIALIALSTIVIPLLLFSIFMVHKYRILSRTLTNTNYLDDAGSTLSMEPLRPGLRP